MGHLSFVNQFSKASTASDRKGTKYQWKIGFLRIQSTTRDLCWSFWWQGWSNNQDQEVFWEKRAVEAVEASKVAEVTEVNEAAEVSKAWKITFEDCRVIQVLEFSNLRTKITLFWWFEKNIFLQNHVEFLHLFCQRLLRPAHVIFLKTGWWNTNVQSSWSH